jgi:hypothetical protein
MIHQNFRSKEQNEVVVSHYQIFSQSYLNKAKHLIGFLEHVIVFLNSQNCLSLCIQYSVFASERIHVMLPICKVQVSIHIKLKVK